MEFLREAWHSQPWYISVPTAFFVLGAVAVVQNVARQIFFADRHRPPVVFHLFPLIGSTVQYGMDPFKFFADCREKYGDCFTFILVGQPTTVFLGTTGNNFILNGKHADLNAEQVYSKLTTPVFGKGVVYDCPNERHMDQKRLVKEGFTTEALRSYIPIFVCEVEDFIARSPHFANKTSGVCNIVEAMAEITIYTASASLQGPEVREKFDDTYAVLYRHLDDGFQPINFMAPWLPLPQNRRRDHAQQVMEKLYADIIAKRRASGKRPDPSDGEWDLIWTLMDAQYKDGTRVPDEHVSRMLIAVLMGGQHNTAASGAWAMLHLAHKPELIEDLYQEQIRVLGSPLPPLTLEHLSKLTLNQHVIKETLRLHTPIHSILRQCTRPLPVPDTDWVIPPGHTLLASPAFLGRSGEYFSRPEEWDPYRWDKVGSDVPNVEDDDNDDSVPKINYGFGLVNKTVRSPYLPFGAGRHRCTGEQYAYAQMGAILATAVRLLTWEQVDPEAPVPPTDYSSMFSRPMNPAQIKWQLRKS